MNGVKYRLEEGNLENIMKKQSHSPQRSISNIGTSILESVQKQDSRKTGPLWGL